MQTDQQPLRFLSLLLAGLVHLCAIAAPAAAGDVPPVRVFAADAMPLDSDSFGFTVDLDGGTLVVGAPRASGPNSDDDGAVYVYVRSGSAWIEQARLTPEPGPPVLTLYGFGTQVALDGDTLAVSFPGDDDFGLDSGSVSVFVRSGTSWSLQQRLVASDGLQADRLGASLALSGDQLVAGAPGEDDNGNSAGAAYVFARSGTSWTQEAKLLAGDGEAEDGFGTAVDIEGDRAIVGAPFEDSVGAASGSVYVFERAGTSWPQAAQLFAVGPATAGALLGSAVALSGDRLAAGGPNSYAPPLVGGVWVFERAGGAWSQTARLVAAESSNGSGMGRALDLEGDTLLVGGAWQLWDTDWRTGAAWAFRARGGSWTQAALILGDPAGDDDFFGGAVALDGELVAVGATLGGGFPFGPGFVDVGLIPTGEPPLAVAEQEKLHAPDGETGDQYGVSVAVDGATMVIGADADFGDNRGSAYVHEHDGSAWVFRAKLVQADVPPGASRFGRAVAVDGDTILVGAPYNSNANGSAAGAAYVFVRSGTDWVQEQKLLAVDPTAQTNDHFGSAVAIDGDTLVVGADQGEGAGGNVGAMYVFARNGTVWTQQAKLFAPTTPTGGYAWSVDVDGDTAVAGAWAHRVGGQRTGAAFVYRRTGTTWAQEAQLVAADSLADGELGRGVALEGDTLVVGAPRQRADVAIDHGTAYVFERAGTTWTETAALRPAGPAFSLRGLGGFGTRVALSGGRLAVLAAQVDDTQRLFVYARSGSSWTEAGRFVPTTPLQPTTLLPFSMALDGATLALGAPLDDDAASDAGAVYLWDALLVPFVPFCTATPNSTGLPAHIDVSGSNSVAANDLVFTVTDMPPGQSGLVIYSPDQASLPLGNGILCLGNQTQGFVNRLPPTTSSPGGVLVHALDVTMPPTPLSQILPGSTWSFSGWFRDVPAGGAGFDFSDGVQVTFAP